MNAEQEPVRNLTVEECEDLATGMSKDAADGRLDRRRDIEPRPCSDEAIDIAHGESSNLRQSHHSHQPIIIGRFRLSF
jgi:hypothetical protein